MIKYLYRDMHAASLNHGDNYKYNQLLFSGSSIPHYAANCKQNL